MDPLQYCQGALDRERERRGFYPPLERIRLPDWGRENGFGPIEDDQEPLLDFGRVVWARIVQANMNIFEDGPEDHPCATLFFDRPGPIESLDALDKLAGKIFSLKGSTEQAPRDLRRVVEVITDELSTELNLALPLSATGGETIYYTSTMLFRDHLPGRRLVSSWFPYVVLPERTPASIVLPERFWPGGLRDYWLGVGDSDDNGGSDG